MWGVGKSKSRIIYLLPVLLFIMLYACTVPEAPEVNPDIPVDSIVDRSCPGLSTVNHAGKTYHTVQIGEQCWLKENLDVGNMIDHKSSSTDNNIIEKYCIDDDPQNCEKYGGLYQWDELMDYTQLEGGKGICPEGWHIPTDLELKVLLGTVDTQYDVGDHEWDTVQWHGYDGGGHLKATGNNHWDSPNEGATNSSGFSALPHGYREFEGNGFNGARAYLVLWTSSQVDENEAWRRALSYYYKEVFRSHHNKGFGYSARCIKD